MKNKFSFFVFIVISLVIIILVIKFPQRIFDYDNFGFYMHLPNVFIYHDVTLRDLSGINSINEKYHLTPALYQLEPLHNGNIVNRFMIGLAVLMAPFFFIGHLLALISSFPADGYSEPYVWAILVAGIFYTMLGFFMMRKILLNFFDDHSTALTLAIFFFGTNIFMFSSLGNPVPHVYILTIYTFLIYYTMQWHKAPKIRYAVIIGLSAGLIIISRPSEVICLIIPLFWGIYNKNSLIEKLDLLVENWNHLIVVVIFMFIAGLPQMIYWQWVVERPVFFPYNDPQSGLNLFAPRFAWVLFSFRKGWLVYSPLMVLSLVGFIFLLKKQKKLFLPLVIFFIINLYLIASFSSLVSYGYRAFIQSYAALILPFGYVVDYLYKQKQWIRIAVSIVLLGFFYINIFQGWQLRIGVIDGSRMTDSYYWKTFLKLNVKPEDRDLLLVNRFFEGPEKIENELKYNKKILFDQPFEQKINGLEKYYDSAYSSSGKFSIRMDSTFIYSPGLAVPYKQITSEYYAWIRASVKVYPVFPPEECLTNLVVVFEYKKKKYKYQDQGITGDNIKLVPGQWNTITMDYLTPEVRSVDDILKVFVWFRGKKPIYIDDLRVEAFTLD